MLISYFETLRKFSLDSFNYLKYNEDALLHNNYKNPYLNQ